MSIEAVSALVRGTYEIWRITVETQPETNVRLDLRSDQGTAVVMLVGVADLEIKQQFSNWPFGFEFYDISDR